MSTNNVSLTQTTDPLQGIVLITSNLRIWSGTAQLRRSTDLKEVAEKLPPREMVSDGRKMLIDTKHLAPFQAIRKRLERLFLKYGFRLMPDSWAIPESDLKEVMEQIDELKTEFESEIPDFVLSLPRLYAEQQGRFPEWADQLKSSSPEPDYVETRMKFRVCIYKLAKPAEDANDGLKDSYDGLINSAVPALLEDLAGKASTLLSGPLGTKLIVGQQQANMVRRLVERLHAFSFLDHRVGAAADGLAAMLDIVPHQGKLTVSESAVLRVVAEQLTDSEGLLQQLDASCDDEEQESTQPTVVPTIPNTPSVLDAPTQTGFVGL